MATRAVASAGGRGDINVLTKRPRRIASTQMIGPDERAAPSGRIAFIEDEIDYRQHRLQALGHLVRLRHAIRNAGVANLALCSNQSLCHRRRRHQKGPAEKYRSDLTSLFRACGIRSSIRGR